MADTPDQGRQGFDQNNLFGIKNHGLIGNYSVVNNHSGVPGKLELPYVPDAAYDHFKNEHDSICLENTRTQLLHDITTWAGDTQGPCMFWLSGMAGTGKSTISRTVAKSFDETKRLGASFFFKRGEGDRGNSAKFFTSLAMQLSKKLPKIIKDNYRQYLKEAVDGDSDLAECSLEKQFDKLIIHPLSKTHIDSSQSPTVVIVIDALDECDEERNVQKIIRLLPRLKEITHLSIRVFMTSRPDLPIRSGFQQVDKGAYKDLVLQEVARSTIEHDIREFFNSEFHSIRRKSQLAPEDWPGLSIIDQLVQMATPLFIFASTVCRFIGAKGKNPKTQLASILEGRMKGRTSKFEQTYRPILDQMFDETDPLELEEQYKAFRKIIGPVVVLASPLSVESLSQLLVLPDGDITCLLRLLYSVLNVPEERDQPVRLLHLSFADFLLDSKSQGQHWSYINEKKTHNDLTLHCIRLLSMPDGLRYNIGMLSRFGPISKGDKKKAAKTHLSPTMQYACRYWVYHLEQSERTTDVYVLIEEFLRKHFLHWLEVMSLLGYISESINMLRSLDSLVQEHENSGLYGFVHDAKRLVLSSRVGIEQAPLQIYVSALLFAPENSIVRQAFWKLIPSWITMKSKRLENWNPVLQTLEGHTYTVSSVAFSSDGRQLASGSFDKTVRLWDATTGEQLRKLKGHTGSIRSVAFSKDGSQVASVTMNEVMLWDATTGEQLRKHNPKPYTRNVLAVAFSSDGIQVASNEYNTLDLWDAATGTLLRKLEGYSYISSIAFSGDGSQVVFSSVDGKVRLWNVTTGNPLWEVEGHRKTITTIAFSNNGNQIVSYSNYGIMLWDAMTGEQLSKYEYSRVGIASIAFSSQNKQVALGSWDKTVKLLDTATGVGPRNLKDHTEMGSSVAFSSDGEQVASGLGNGRVMIWDAKTGKQLWKIEGHTREITSVGFSSDGKQVASGSGDCTVIIWDAKTGKQLRKLGSHTGIISVAFSRDGKQVASGLRDGIVMIWDAETGKQLRKLAGFTSLSKALSSDMSLRNDFGGQIETSLGVKRTWITCGEQKVLWLPTHHRGKVVDMNRDIIVLHGKEFLGSYIILHIGAFI